MQEPPWHEAWHSSVSEQMNRKWTSGIVHLLIYCVYIIEKLCSCCRGNQCAACHHWVGVWRISEQSMQTHSLHVGEALQWIALNSNELGVRCILKNIKDNWNICVEKSKWVS